MMMYNLVYRLRKAAMDLDQFEKENPKTSDRAGLQLEAADKLEWLDEQLLTSLERESKTARNGYKLALSMLNK